MDIWTSSVGNLNAKKKTHILPIFQPTGLRFLVGITQSADSQYIHTQTKPTETSCSINACMPGVLLADIYSRGDGISKASSKGTLLLLFGVPLLPQGRIPGPFNLIFQP